MAFSTCLSLLSSGSNAQGHLGNGTLDDSYAFQRCSFLNSPHTLPPGTSRVVDIATGANHTLVLLEVAGRRELWGCGDSRKGQLGRTYQQPTTVFRKLDMPLKGTSLDGFEFKFISATWETSYVVLSKEGQSDVVLSMGSDDFGDLGIGGLKKDHPPKDFHIVNFDHIPELSEYLDILRIYSGQRHVVLHINSPSSPILVGWGSSRHGQLGDANGKPFVSAPKVVSTTSAKDSCALGIHHTIILSESGELVCLGSNRRGQLEVGKMTTATDAGCTWNGTYVVAQDHDQWTVYSSGSNSHKQLGWKEEEGSSVGQVNLPDALDRRGTHPKIVCGSEHVLLLVPSPPGTPSQLWGWGWNEHGNLGIGHTDDVPIPTKIWPPLGENSNVIAAWAGLGTSWICVEEHAV